MGIVPKLVDRPRCFFGSIATLSRVGHSFGLAWLAEVLSEIIVPSVAPGELDKYHFVWRSEEKPEDVVTGPADRTTLAGVREGPEVRYIELRLRQFERPNWPSGIGLAFGARTYASGVRMLEVSIRQAEYQHQVKPEVQGTLVNLLERTFVQVDAVSAYVTIDVAGALGLGSPSPYERRWGLSFQEAAESFSTKLRGYYWLTALTRHHVELLGGESAMARAPVWHTKRLDNGAWILQLTENINELTKEQLVPLRQFLEPVLPVPRKMSPEYEASLPNFML